MRGTRRARWLMVIALLLSTSAAATHASASPPPEQGAEPPAVVVTVSDKGFHWTDAGVGAAAALATTFLAVGLVLALRAEHGR